MTKLIKIMIAMIGVLMLALDIAYAEGGAGNKDLVLELGLEVDSVCYLTAEPGAGLSFNDPDGSAGAKDINEATAQDITLHLEDNDFAGSGNLIDAALVGDLPDQYANDVYVMRFDSIAWTAAPDSEIDAEVTEEATLPVDLPKTGGTMNIADVGVGTGKTLHGDIVINPVVHVNADKRIGYSLSPDILTIQFTMVDHNPT